jgi:hypothetical protein
MAHTVASVWAPRTTRGLGRIRAVPRHTVRMDHAPPVRRITRAPGPTDEHAKAPTSTATGAPARCNAATTGRRPRTRRTTVAAHRRPASALTAARQASRASVQAAIAPPSVAHTAATSTPAATATSTGAMRVAAGNRATAPAGGATPHRSEPVNWTAIAPHGRRAINGRPIEAPINGAEAHAPARAATAVVEPPAAVADAVADSPIQPTRITSSNSARRHRKEHEP